MPIYPDLPGPQLRAVAADAIVLSCLLLCLLVGQAVHGAVSELDVLGRGVERAGTQVRDGFEDAGRRVDDAPVVGGRLEDALNRAGRKTGDPVVRAGGRGREAVAELATLLGLVVGGLPAFVILATWLPGRIRRGRALLAARRVFGSVTGDEERRRLLAMRAAFDLPMRDLLRHTEDPFGDLAAGRLDPLLAAIGESVGLAPPTRSAGESGASSNMCS